MKRLIMLLALAAAALGNASADLYSPDRPLAVMETEYFTFIFPPESRPAVEYLASFADDSYREIAELLGTEPRLRLPVVMTPDADEPNGYFTNYPYLRIVLYEAATSSDGSLGSFQDDLRKLFYHELTHAVSLTLRTGFEDVVAAVFGAPFNLSSYLVPSSFAEGVTVSFESRDGHGRAADPYLGAMLRQDILEGRWKTFYQASGAYDRYPNGSQAYIYGGYFSRYLQAAYGMESYARLWRSFGLKSLFIPFDEGLVSKGQFQAIYGTSLSDAWDAFKASMTLRRPVYMATEPLRGLSRVETLTAAGTTLYFADSSAEAVYALDATAGTEERLFKTGATVSRLAAAPDGSRLLVSTYRYEADLPRLVVREWNAATKRLSDLPLEGVRDACYLSGDAIVGIRADGYETDLVVCRGEAVSALLLGSERVSYASPVAADASTIYVLAREDGVVSVVRVRLAGFQIAAVDRLVLPASLSWVRYLSFDEGVLRFSWDDEAFYRLAELRGERLSCQTVPMSGGVHRPVSVNGRVYYLGRFSGGHAPCALPEDRRALGFVDLKAIWRDASGLLETVSAYDAAPALESRPYGPLPWLFPRCWFPLVAGDWDGVSALGAVLISADPAERFFASLAADWDLRAEAADLELRLEWSRFPARLSLGLADAFDAEAGGPSLRRSSVTLGLDDSIRLDSGPTFGWSLQAALEGYASAPAGASAYASWSQAATGAIATLALADTSAPLSDPESRTGYSMALLGRTALSVHPEAGEPTTGFEGRAVGYLGTAAALTVSAYGAVSASPALSYGAGARAYEGLCPLWAEFDGEASGRWFAEGELSARLVGAELQRGMQALYANRLALNAGARGYLVGPDDWSGGLADMGWSAFARLSLTWTPAVGVAANLHPLSYGEVWYRPDEAGEDGSWGFSYSIVASY